jgi:hypothetical protein
VLGYLAGASYHCVEQVASRVGLGLLGLIVIGLVASRLLRRLAARSPGLEAFGDRLAATTPPAWVRHRFPGQVAWGRRRIDPTSLRGFWLTFTIVVGALAAWAFGGLTQDVVGHDEAALADPHVTAWVVAHRTEWLTVKGTETLITPRPAHHVSVLSRPTHGRRGSNMPETPSTPGS